MSDQLTIGGVLINFTRNEALPSNIISLRSTHTLPLFGESSSFKMNKKDDDIHYVCVITIRNPFTSFDFFNIYLHEVTLELNLNDGTENIKYIRAGDISSPFYILSFNQQGDYSKHINFSDLSEGLKDLTLKSTLDDEITLHMHTVVLLSTDDLSSDYSDTILNDLSQDTYIKYYDGDFETWFNRYVKYEDTNNQCKIIS